MKYLEVLLDITLCLFVIIKSALPEALMCSKCKSAQDKNGADCEKNPPPPVRCFASSGVNYCMIAREYNKFGEEINFIRDCSTRRTLGESCINTNVTVPENPKLPVKVCYNICNTDGCNTSHKFSFSSNLILSSLIMAACLILNRGFAILS